MLGNLADRFFGRLGYVLMRKAQFIETRGTLGWERLSMIPIKPKTVIDVGVGYGTPDLYEAFPSARLILIEPLIEYDEHIKAILKRRTGTHLQVALGSADAELTINVEPELAQKSSFLNRTIDTITGDRVVGRTVAVRRLDSLVSAEDIARPAGLKIDVEGFELEVLRGATGTLELVDFVIVETSLSDRFEGSPAFVDVVAEMGRNGFKVYDFLHIARASGPGARHADVLFVRT